MEQASPKAELRAKRRASGEWDVLGPNGEQLANGFDTEAEAEEWIEERENGQADLD
jgi:hypothetical protein